MNDQKLSEALAQAGIRFRGIDETLARLPVRAAWIAVSCGPGDGRRDIVLDASDANVVGNANSSWFDLASESGLFSGPNREFLLGVDLADNDSASILRWAKVELMEDWDIMGGGADGGMLGSGAGKPEFVMMSTSGEVVLRGTTWEDAIGVLAVPMPDRVKLIRDYAGRLSSNSKSDFHERRSASEWLHRL
ncbi:hypothetical protein [Streptomyces sp. SP2-10]|uniref:hypothetical protein n=1 Tax=Streptomyces sp. SP2-10 TaxID=2873385 RepID=UPI001CA7607D|nr:hypothetical protein [Streptomyces sp. SP2-10]MBY8845583.1 hypothetical protein [Streptomyces sp. SP2-10]